MRQKQVNQIRRHRRVRAKISGTAARPRLAVFRSNRYLHLQLIDDEAQKTLAAASTRELPERPAKKAAAAAVAKLLAERAQKLEIKSLVFDRGGFRYHGHVQAVAEALRQAGLKF